MYSQKNWVWNYILKRLPTIYSLNLLLYIILVYILNI